MKKILLKIFVNLLVFIVLYTFLDLTAFICLNKQWSKELYRTNFKKYVFNCLTEYISWNHTPFVSNSYLKKHLIYPEIHRPIENKDKEPEILIFGCSFAHGVELQDDETFSYFLAKETGYKVINRAFMGRSAQHMLYQLEDDDFYKIIPKPKYIIYVYIYEQMIRTYIPTIFWDKNVYYKRTKDNRLGIKRFSLNYIHTFIIGYLAYWYCVNVLEKSEIGKNYYDFYFLHIMQSLEDIKKHWGDDVKVIFFNYYETYEIYDIPKKYIKDMEDKGVTVVNLKELSDTNYDNLKYQISKSDTHPNKKAWEEITPLFVKYLNDKGYMLPVK